MAIKAKANSLRWFHLHVVRGGQEMRFTTGSMDLNRIAAVSFLGVWDILTVFVCLAALLFFCPLVFSNESCCLKRCSCLLCMLCGVCALMLLFCPLQDLQPEWVQLSRTAMFLKLYPFRLQVLQATKKQHQETHATQQA